MCRLFAGVQQAFESEHQQIDSHRRSLLASSLKSHNSNDNAVCTYTKTMPFGNDDRGFVCRWSDIDGDGCCDYRFLTTAGTTAMTTIRLRTPITLMFVRAVRTAL
jgi:hypothetical protein